MSLQPKLHGIYERRDGVIDACTSLTDDGALVCMGMGNTVWKGSGRHPISVGREHERDLIREIVVGEGWLPWNGGENPAPNSRVDYVVRAGAMNWEPRPSDLLVWQWKGSPSDIVAYRVVKEKAEPVPSQVIPPRDQFERINELLKANNALVERARKADHRGDELAADLAAAIARAHNAEARAEALAAELAEKIRDANDTFDAFHAEVAERDRRITALQACLANVPAYPVDSPPAFYMVHGAGCGGANYRHGSRESAMAEAKRLSANRPGTPFAYLRAEGEFFVPVTDPVHRVLNPDVAAAVKPSDDIPF